MNTFSCYTPILENRKITALLDTKIKHVITTKECFSCPACFRKNVVLWAAGIFLPFDNDEIVEKYYKEFNNIKVLSPRGKATLDYVERLRQWQKEKRR